MSPSLNPPSRPATAPAPETLSTDRRAGKPRPLSLALQGGGALGAFTWGVLDRLLQEDVAIDCVSGASAGAVNAVLLASGLAKGGPEGARQALDSFWTKLGRYSLPRSSEMMLFASVRLASPYQFNPLDVNPVRDLLAGEVDFEALRRDDAVRLLISATRVSDGALRIFRNAEITSDVVAASACLPQIQQAVSIEGESYWDGGYASNPPLVELVAESRAAELLLVQLIPTHGGDLPRTKRAIESRLSQITFNTPLQGELEALATMIKLCRDDGDAGGSALSEKLQRLQMHRIAAEDHVDKLDESSSVHVDHQALGALRDQGRVAAEAWLRDGSGADRPLDA